MKKLLLIILTGILATSLLVACSNDGETQNDENDNTEIDKAEITESQNTEDAEEDDASDVETEDNIEDSSGGLSSSESDGGIFEVTEEPQMELRLGDTGLVQTSIGTYELTLESAEIIGTELDGEEALLDELILLEMTFKNIDDKPLKAEDLMMNLGITTNLEHSNEFNSAAYFESIEFFEGEIAPGEERAAQFISDTRTADEYYFRPNQGTVSAGTHNDFLWTITDEEARN